eukprot:4918943-Alexandrium_andersonii.AAC.1
MLLGSLRFRQFELRTLAGCSPPGAVQSSNACRPDACMPAAPAVDVRAYKSFGRNRRTPCEPQEHAND